ncbi:MAG: hypothetical protein CVU05_05935 [Bacteroidetes bacterium HGW-Bacteroidetes-21]|nr:MAG: hypothetical protein CVU05_05935 [Bacteroidetes bacterium HGW-Bacteroidetes-21]
MKKSLASIIIAMGFLTTAWSVPVSFQQSIKLANNFILSMPHIFAGDYSIISTDSAVANGQVLYRIYRLSPKGYVIVSADDRFFPIPAFSSDGDFATSPLPGSSHFLGKYRNEMLDAISRGMTATEETRMAWENIENTRYFKGQFKQTRSVTPMVSTKWNQNYPYNILCPEDGEGSGGHTYAGCVATAMGQLMYYHRWPQTGTGNYEYTHPEYGVISADFSAATYDWNAMPTQVPFENLAVGQLLFHLGVSVDMDYGPDGSGMWNHSAARSLRNYFKYCPETRYIFRDSTTLNWDSLVITNLQARKPLYYAGWSDTTFTSGHAFVCDGYETNDYYHFNWGWGGSYDGYFYSGQMNPGGSNFNLLQELIVDIYPDTIQYTFPGYCSGQEELNSISGSISDGSANLQYTSNAHCSWWINPECGSSPEITFEQFALGATDTLFIFDGNPSENTLISFFSANNAPALTSETDPTTITGVSGQFYIEFHAHEQNEGFLLNYNTIYCTNDTVFEDQGILSDGSGDCEYRKNTSCRWVIAAPGAERYHFTTTEFDLFAGSVNHSIQIYKESISSANFLYKYTSATPPPTAFTIDASKVIIRFLSTSTGTGQGWSFNYNATALNVDPNDYTTNIFVFPNPSQGIVSFSEKFENVIVTDVTGKILLHTFSVNQVDLSNLQNGVYFTTTSNGSSTYRNKVILKKD